MNLSSVFTCSRKHCLSGASFPFWKSVIFIFPVLSRQNCRVENVWDLFLFFSERLFSPGSSHRYFVKIKRSLPAPPQDLAIRQSVFLGSWFSERIRTFICDQCSEGASLCQCLLLLLVLKNSLNTTSAALWINERTDVLVLGFHSYINSLTKYHLHKDYRANSIP